MRRAKKGRAAGELAVTGSFQRPLPQHHRGGAHRGGRGLPPGRRVAAHRQRRGGRHGGNELDRAEDVSSFNTTADAYVTTCSSVSGSWDHALPQRLPLQRHRRADRFVGAQPAGRRSTEHRRHLVRRDHLRPELDGQGQLHQHRRAPSRGAACHRRAGQHGARAAAASSGSRCTSSTCAGRRSWCTGRARSPRPSHRLRPRRHAKAPAPRWRKRCAFAYVESMATVVSIHPLATSAPKVRCQMRRRDQRLKRL